MPRPAGHRHCPQAHVHRAWDHRRWGCQSTAGFCHQGGVCQPLYAPPEPAPPSTLPGVPGGRSPGARHDSLTSASQGFPTMAGLARHRRAVRLQVHSSGSFPSNSGSLAQAASPPACALTRRARRGQQLPGASSETSHGTLLTPPALPTTL